MNRPSAHIIFPVLAAALLGIALMDTVMGSVGIPLSSVFRVLSGQESDPGHAYILLQLRLPRVITAIVTGAGLSAAGLMMQTLFRNPLAGPYVLGISSGASLGVALLTMSAGLLGIVATIMISFWGQVIAAVAGSLLVFILLLLAAGKISDSVSLLIVGIMFGSMTTALVSILQFFSRPDQVHRYVIWTMGSLSSTTWKQILVLLPSVLAGLAITIYLIKPMNALLLGENNARSSGVPVMRVRYLILISSSVIAGSLTAFTGPIAFVGLAVPHLARMLFRTSNHRIVVPGSLLIGSILLLVCDLISQVPGKAFVLPVNAITALFGAPVVLWIIIGRKKLKTGF